MKKALITRSGQMSVPASIRHRWGTREVLVDDRGDDFVVRPAPENPIAAFRGNLKGRGPSTGAARELAHEEDARRDGERATKQRRRSR